MIKSNEIRSISTPKEGAVQVQHTAAGCYLRVIDNNRTVEVYLDSEDREMLIRVLGNKEE